MQYILIEASCQEQKIFWVWYKFGTIWVSLVRLGLHLFYLLRFKCYTCGGDGTDVEQPSQTTAPFGSSHFYK